MPTMAMKLAPLVRTGTGTDAGSLPRIPPLRRHKAAGSIRASPASSWEGEAARPATSPNLCCQTRSGGAATRSGTAKDSASVSISAAPAPASPLAGESRSPAPSPYAVSHSNYPLFGAREQTNEVSDSLPFRLVSNSELSWLITAGSEATRAEARADAARRGSTEADELIVGLPVSADGSETPQSKVRSVVGRLAVRAAERGLRVYLQDEFGTSIDALELMISRGVKKSARDVKSGAYAAVMILEDISHHQVKGLILFFLGNQNYRIS